jgi:hypothetical protein
VNKFPFNTALQGPVLQKNYPDFFVLHISNSFPLHVWERQYQNSTYNGRQSRQIFQVEASCVLTPCSVVVGYVCFEGSCCLHLQGEYGGRTGLLYITTRRNIPKGFDLNLHRFQNLKSQQIFA